MKICHKTVTMSDMQPDNNNMPPQAYPPQQPIMPLGPEKRHSGAGIFILLAVFVLLTLVGVGFGFWAFSERNDYKNNVDQKIEAAVTEAVEKNGTAKEAEFAERIKSPFDEYRGPAAFGSVAIKYPRTWSAFVSEEDRGTTPVDGYFHPNIIPGLRSGTAYALRLQVLGGDYTKELAKFDSASKAGRVRVSAIELQGVAGARIDGEIERDRRGSVVLFPIRDKTLKLTTESESFVGDFNDIILPNLTFSP